MGVGSAFFFSREILRMNKEDINQVKYQANVRMDLNALIKETKKLFEKVDSLEAIVKLNYTPRKT